MAFIGDIGYNSFIQFTEKRFAMLILDLFLTFFKIGAFTFGGGYAMIPLIEREIINNKGWIEEEELLEVISVSQMTPGVIAINAATFVGKKTAGLSGAIIASIAVILPSLFIISFIVHFVADSFTSPVAKKILTGVRAGVVAMIFKSLIRLFKSSANTPMGVVIFIFTMICLIFSLLSPIKLIVMGAAFGLILYTLLPSVALRAMGRGTE